MFAGKWERGALKEAGLTTLPSSYAACLEIRDPQPPGTLRACPDLYRDCSTFTFTFTCHVHVASPGLWRRVF
jgi:hypothetical protein